jgi:hypothetical protein
MRTHAYLLLVRAPPALLLLLLHVLSVGAVGVVELLHLCCHLLAQEPLLHRQLFVQLHLLLCCQFVEQLRLSVWCLYRWQAQGCMCGGCGCGRRPANIIAHVISGELQASASRTRGPALDELAWILYQPVHGGFEF